ncbi:MAG TPA: ribosome biogenesis GTPase Der, partial [Acidimicrobiales bacterium]|nr:ribosome biogenesis GTPase Der [Acidimicrobiales bacterium]
RDFTLVDTGGWQAGGVALDKLVSAQAQRAVEQADAILFVVDVTVGPTEADADVARLLLRSGRPVVLAVNKVDNETREADIWEFAALGFAEPWPVSALHGRGAGDLLDALVTVLPPRDNEVATGEEPPGMETVDEAGQYEPGQAGEISVAIVGRPNVGKSTIFNRLIGDDRAIVHDMPGTTRDAIDTLVETPDGPVRFIDTAGMRRRTKEAEGAEYYSMVRALRAIDRATLALLVIDAGEGVTRQDQRLAERVDAAGNPVVVVLNKWDVLDAEAKARVRADVADMLGFLSYAPALEISAKTGRGVHRLYPALARAVDAYRRRVPTSALNRALAAAQAAQPAPHGARVLYATQGATDPPTFTLFTSKELPASYMRYLERSIREHFGFGPTPLKLRARRRAS